MQAALVMDTCGAEGYVAVCSAEELEPKALSERRLGVRATQEELLPAVGFVLSEAGLKLQELRAVAVVRGPGSFTGVRIGLATAKGLCEAAGLPLVLLSRLQALAGAAESGDSVLAYLQAGRGEVYAARYRTANLGGVAGSVSNADEVLLEPCVLPRQEAIDLAESEPGSVGVVVYERELLDAFPNAHLVDAPALEQSLRTAAAEAVREQCWSDVALTDALYLRVPDAELALRGKPA